jgi:hypothetical protein
VHSPLEWALHYASLGFAPVPLWGTREDGSCMCGNQDCTRSAGKHPKGGKGWEKSATCDIDRVRDVFRGHHGNMGILVGPDHVVIDCDGTIGRATYDGMGAPETWTQETGGCGLHCVFALAPHHDRTRLKNRKVLDHIDLKHGTGQIVVQPSVHRTGGVYVWRSDGPIAVLPDSLYEIVAAPLSAPPPSSSDNVIPFDPGDRMKRARAYIAKMPDAIEGSGGSDATFNVARKLVKDLHLDQNEAWTVLCEYNSTSCHPPWNEKDLRHKFDSAIKARVSNPVADRPYPGSAAPALAQPADWTNVLARGKPDKSGHRPILENQSNAQLILLHNPAMRGRVRRNLLSGATEAFSFPFDDDAGGARSGQWSDIFTTRLQATLERMHRVFGKGLTFSDRALDAAVESVAGLNEIHPVRDWLGGLVWDGVPRVDTWLSEYFGVEDTPWSRTVGARFLISAVARIFRPGCKVDTVLIFECGQGSGKSTGLEALFGRDWFTDTPIDIGTKDAYQNLAGKWCVELGELSSFSKRDANQLKVFFSSHSDTYRPSYGRRTVTVPRQCVFCGSTNQDTYLQDETGNRRYWPVRVGRTDHAGLTRNRSQLWAESLARFQAGEPWWLSWEEELVFTDERASRVVGDPWSQPISAMLEIRDHVTIPDILSSLGVDQCRHTQADMNRVARVLKLLRWERKKRRLPGGKFEWRYVPTHGVGTLVEVGT